MERNKKTKAFIIGIIPVLILYIIIMGVVFSRYNSQKNQFIENTCSNMKNEMELITIVYQTFSDFLYEKYLKDPEISSLLYQSFTEPETKDKNRTILKDKMDFLYKDLLKSSYRQLHFHLPDTESFLRMHRPKKFGDKLAQVRETVRITNLYKTRSIGFEEGRIFNGYRYVYPLSHNGKHAGSVEISISFNAIIESLSNHFNKKYTFIIKKEIVDEKVFLSEKSNYSNFCLDSTFLIDRDISQYDFCTAYTDYFTNNSKSAQKLFNSFKKAEDFILPLQDKKVKILLSAIKIFNFKKEHAGYLISADSIDNYNALKTQLISMIIMLTVIFILILLLTEYYIWSRIKFEELAMHDKLTSIYNRQMFVEVFKQTISRMKRFETSSVLVMADIDLFKNINDKYGHNKGDQVLIKCSEIIKSSIRESDIVARWGGEEFIILLPKTALENGIETAEKIRKNIQDSDFNIDSELTCSFGVSVFSEKDTDLAQIIEKTDQMLYRSKNSGRNIVSG